jgi:poly(3-hydroxybutyrate) depolymerase
MFRSIIAVSLIVIAGVSSGCSGQAEQAGQTQAQQHEQVWPEEVRDVELVSSVDGAVQMAKFYVPEQADGPLPLLVMLHTWSGSWTQDMGIDWLEQARQRGWVFIHSDFRGPNGKVESTGSELATADIMDALAYARRHANVDSSRIYLAGVSGGGHMSLLTAGRKPEIWAGVSAWVPIFDLARWHTECVERELGYAGQMEAACGGVPGSSDETDRQYLARSSKSVLHHAGGVNIEINAGIHDGHTGSVPVGHTLRAFNMLATANGLAGKALTEETIKEFESGEAVPDELAGERTDDPFYGEKTVLFRRQAGPARVTVFEGGHEGIAAAACEWLSRQRHD